MTTSREEKIARMLQKELGEFFLLYARQKNGVIISVTDVRLSPDLSLARVYLSIFPQDKAKDIFSVVNIDTKTIRYELGKRIRHQLRIVPELTFILDTSLDYLEKIDELLRN
ncbi:MAG: 30S ribosome-binding factor RbfA [Prevotellaceae bacterium]|jgi:ribosome-binding factor A|nr:30S ribosome-binding factor RbfA [Prevotellaceae bacterium]